MKLEQLRYVLEIYRTGSISKAAERFYLSRSNISSAMRNLESELGFEIMERSTSGVKFTEKGLLLVQKCQKIVKEADEIHGLAEEETRLEFGIVNPHFPPLDTAYAKFCVFLKEDPTIHGYKLSSYREYQYEAMRLLEQKKVNLAFTVSNNLTAPSLSRELAERGLTYRRLLDLPCQINLAKAHPLTKDPDFSVQKLRDYPFVDYIHEKDRGSPYNRIGAVSFINLDKLIRVDSGETRTKVVASTDAYSFGVAMPPDWAEQNGIVSIPIRNITMEFGLLRRNDQPVSELEKTFMEIVMKELSYLS